MVIREVPLYRVALKISVSISPCQWFLLLSLHFLFFGPLVAVYMQKKQSKGTKRKTRQAKALENARKAPRTFLELLHEVRREMLLILLFVFKLL